MVEAIASKVCKTCGLQKATGEFYSFRRNRDGLRHDCKACIKDYSAARRKENPEPDRARSAARYAARTGAWRCPEKAKARTAQWRADNPERAKAARAAYVRENADKQNAQVARRKAAKLRATPHWADEQAIKAVYRAAKELTEATGLIHHVDHVVPLKSHLVCGLHCQANLRVLRGKENNAKGNRYWPDMP